MRDHFRFPAFCLFWLMMIFTPAAWSQTTETPTAIAEAPVDLPIPDGDSIGITSSIHISGSTLLEQLEVALQIDHPAVEQLLISLTSPSGTTAILHYHTASDQSPFSPVYESLNPSAESLTKFIGKSAQGDWKMTVADTVAGQTGTWRAWGLKVKPASLLQPVRPTPVPLPASLFQAAGSLDVSLTISNLASADLNADGLYDLILLSETENQVAIYFSQGDSFMGTPLSYEITRPQKIAFGDWNADQRPDFIIASQEANIPITTITVFLGNSAGGFSEGFATSLATALDRMSIVDVNSDGKQDLVLGGTPQYLEGVGDGSFKPTAQFVYMGRAYWAHGDLSDDGRDDHFVTLSRGGTSPNADPYVLLGGTDSAFPDRWPFTLLGTLVDAFFAPVFDSSDPEFVAVYSSGDADGSYWFQEIRADETGTPSATQIRLSNTLLGVPIIPYDVNQDGLVELLYLNKNGIQAFQRTDDATGGKTAQLFAYASPRLIALGKFFTNNILGLAIVGSSSKITLLRSTLVEQPTPTPTLPSAPTPTPFLFPTATPRPALPTPTPTSISPSQINPDINHDGIVDRQDLFLLLQYWGQKIN